MVIKNKDSIIENGFTEKLKKARKDVVSVLENSLNAVDPYNAVEKMIDKGILKLKNKDVDLHDFDNVYVIGFGKASFGMTQAVCDNFDVDSGVAISNKSDDKVSCENIGCFIGGHPVPNEDSLVGAKRVVEIVEKCESNDLVIVLISGGGSALLCNPRVDLDDMKKTTGFLLKSGANINEINTVRKHLSYVKGGQLASYCKGNMISLIISDIVNDPLEFIASGPTYPDSTNFQDSYDVLVKYDLWDKVPDDVRDVINLGLNKEIPETPKADDVCFDGVLNEVIANNRLAVFSAVDKAKKLGYNPHVLDTSLTGEARVVASDLLDYINSKEFSDKDFFISGGETTVTVKGAGKGGRNQEMVLASVERIDGRDLLFVSFATDGIDGDSNAAGAVSDGFSLKRAHDNDLNPNCFLKDNDSYSFFKKLNDVFITGPTGTNVMDIQIIVKT
ncbi:MAG: DUF4147 domain-containing protein [Candidatus Thermoplasmatota archaeon]